MTRDCTIEIFLSDVEKHEMTIMRDDDVYRHIRFKRPDTGCYHFDLITWPGYLCYTGDMGTYVFSRTKDMFEFFRTDREYEHKRGRKLGINLSYWSEKLKAVDGNRRNGSAMEFDPEKFKHVINEYRVGWIKHEARRYNGLDKEGRRDLWEAVQDEVLSRIDDGEHACLQAAYDFHYRKPGGGAICFEDLFEHNFNDYTFHFVWCCYALAWGVEKYDATKSEKAAA